MVGLWVHHVSEKNFQKSKYRFRYRSLLLVPFTSEKGKIRILFGFLNHTCRIIELRTVECSVYGFSSLRKICRRTLLKCYMQDGPVARHCRQPHENLRAICVLSCLEVFEDLQ